MTKTRFDHTINDVPDPVRASVEALYCGFFEGLNLDRFENRRAISYLATVEGAPCETLIHLCLLSQYKAQPTASWDGDVFEYAQRALARYQTQQLPSDLAWAVREALNNERRWDIHHLLALVHACEHLPIAHQLQMIIDTFDARLREIGCNERTEPLIMGPPAIFGMREKDDQVIGGGGMYFANYFSRVSGEMIIGGLADTCPRMMHMIAHEMVHSTQKGGWPDLWTTMHWLEGVTELVTEQLTERALLGYDTETEMARGLMQNYDDPIQQAVSFSNEAGSVLGTYSLSMRQNIDRYFEENVVCIDSSQAEVIAAADQLQLRYVAQAGAGFVTDELSHCLYRDIVRPAAEHVLWPDDLVLSEDIEDIYSQLTADMDDVTLQHNQQAVRAAAVCIWSAHVCNEPAVRVARWCLTNHFINTAEIRSVIAWQDNEIAREWFEPCADYSANFWAKVCRIAAPLNITKLLEAQQLVSDSAELDAA